MLVLTVANGAAALVFGWGARLVPESEALRHWAAACLMLALASGVVLLQPHSAMRPVLFNLPLAAGYALWLSGLLRFCRRPPRDHWVLAVVAYCVVLALGLSLLNPQQDLRIGLTGLGLLALRLPTAWLLWRHGSRSHPGIGRTCAVVILIECALIMLRVVAAVRGEAHPVATISGSPAGWLTWFGLVLAVLVTTPLVMLLGLSRLIEQLHQHAHQDPLTQLSNRRGFAARSGPLLAHAKRLGKPCAVLMLDIDRFKSLNDRFGHALGDEVLRVMGETLNEVLRSSDVAVRWGGEEFCALLIGADGAGAHITAERVRQRFSERCAEIAAIKGERVSVSIGIAYGLLGQTDFEGLQQNADAALYQAKQGGRDRAVAASPLAPAGESRAAGKRLPQ